MKSDANEVKAECSETESWICLKAYNRANKSIAYTKNMYCFYPIIK